MQIGITIPIYHTDSAHLDFTKECVNSIRSEEHDLHVLLVVNFSHPELFPHESNFNLDKSVKEFKTTDNPRGTSVACGWNQGIDYLKDACDYVIVANNDIIFNKGAIDQLVAKAEENPEAVMWTGSEYSNWGSIDDFDATELDDTNDEHPHFSCFMINADTVEKIGWFDEKIERAYFEDGDYHLRIILAGEKAMKFNRSKFYHYGSRTIKSDRQLERKNKGSYNRNRKYLQKKWGIDFHGKGWSPPTKILEEDGLYTHPFNLEENDLKYW